MACAFVISAPALPPAVRLGCSHAPSMLCLPAGRLSVEVSSSAGRRARARRSFALGSAWSASSRAASVAHELECARSGVRRAAIQLRARFAAQRSIHAPRPAESAPGASSSSAPRAEAAGAGTAPSRGFGDAPKPKPESKKDEKQQPAKVKGPPVRIPPEPWIIAGLGNPGREYDKTRHNAGFMALDVLAAREGLKFDKQANSGFIARGTIAGVPVTLVKPQTFMNLSGQCVVPIAKFYQIPPQRILVLMDDMDVDIGAIRIRAKGSAGGQKGLKNIIELLGGVQDVPRIRVGIGRPPGKLPPRAYVLQRAAKGEEQLMEAAYERAAEAARAAVMFGIDYAMNNFNGKAA